MRSKQTAMCRRLRPRSSLILKIVIAVTVPLVGVLSVFGYFDLTARERQMLQQSDTTARLLTTVVTRSLKQAMRDGKPGKVKRLAALYEGTQGISEVRVLDADSGEIRASSTGVHVGERVTMGRLRAQKRLGVVETRLLKRERILSTMTAIPNEPECRRCHDRSKLILGMVEVRVPVSDVFEGVAAARVRGVWFTFAVSVLTASATIALISWLINLPIKHLVAGMARVKGGDLEARVQIRSGDELEDLGESFNSMVEQLSLVAEENEDLRKRLERRIDTLDTLGRVATGIAHEMKNPLAGIKAASEVLRDGLPVDDARREIFDEIVHQIGKMDESVKNFLRFARPVPPEIQPTDINQVVESVCLLMNNQGDRLGATIVRECAESLPLINVDPGQMRQVFLNIGVNALESLESRGGQVRFRTGLTQDGKRVCISISDTGRGIPLEDLTRVFQPYFTTKGDGTGLGLSIAQRLVEENGGEISLESQPDKGTTFAIELPVDGRVEE